MAFLKDAGTFAGLTSRLEQLRQLRSDDAPRIREGIRTDLATPGTVMSVRGLYISGGRGHVIQQELDALGGLLSQLRLDLEPVEDPVVVGNLAYLHTSYFWQHIASLRHWLPELPYAPSCILLSRAGNLDRLLELLDADPTLRLSPELGIMTAFKVTHEHGPREAELLPKLADRVPSYGRGALVRTAIRARLDNRAKSVGPLPKPPRVALLVCGQLRNPELGLPLVGQYFDLPLMDVYVSTWQRPGYTTLDRARLPRRLTSEAVETVARSYTDAELQAIGAHERRMAQENRPALEAAVERHLSSARVLHTNMADEDEPVYQKQDNHWKMHFHNSYWVRRLGSQFFLDNYDLVIKTRPDLLLAGDQQLTPATMGDPGRDLYDDHPTWLFEPWGFGVGDQFFWGRTDQMLKVLDIGLPASLSSRLLSHVFGTPRVVQGHISIGIELWLAGGHPRRMDVRKRGLASDELLELAAFEELARHAGVRPRLG